jgi:hypothetical protein
MGSHEVIVAVLHTSSKSSRCLSGLLGQALNSCDIVLLLARKKC